MITAIIQARTWSTRLPNKIFAKIKGKPLIWHIVDRINKSKYIQEIVVATTTNTNDNEIEKWCKENNTKVFRWDEDDVLSRYYHAAVASKATTIVRITADDPFKDPEIIDKVIEIYQNNNLDFAYNNKPPTFPEGLDTEIFSFGALEKAFIESKDVFEREHVTQYFYRNPDKFKQMNWKNDIDLSYCRRTIDTDDDLTMAREVYENLYKEWKIFLMKDIIKLLKEKPNIATLNAKVKRSFMYKK